MAGLLDRVEVLLYEHGSMISTCDLGIYTLSGGAPDTLMAGASHFPSAIPDGAGNEAWVSFDFTDFSVNVGEVYAIVLSATTGGVNFYAWPGTTTSDQYPGGETWYSTPTIPWKGHPNIYDLGFKTYVDAGSAVVPLPPAALLGLGMLGCLAAARRLRRRVT
jgi:hypothetical protein